ncbi:KRAB-A domain-containing protein 2-like [Physella acuta]|uniref:KRAB-A domain-containing protein 2-like n=1 Tax=Physella acuta TaxID=109671 RepID=UPI0027DE5F6B|nr:KRAB-A domain-containing protein 2-like [Physella acuta]
MTTVLHEKPNNSFILSKDKYIAIIEDVKQAKAKQTKKTVDYRRLNKYDVIEVDGKEKLIVPLTEDNGAILYYVHSEELFDLINETHLKIGHGGRTRIEKELKRKYKNITKEIITMYLRLCKPCQTKLSNPKKGLVSKHLIFKEFNSRCQVDLIDMQSNPDGKYKFILSLQVYTQLPGSFNQVHIVASFGNQKSRRSCLPAAGYLHDYWCPKCASIR